MVGGQRRVDCRCVLVHSINGLGGGSGWILADGIPRAMEGTGSVRRGAYRCNVACGGRARFDPLFRAILPADALAQAKLLGSKRDALRIGDRRLRQFAERRRRALRTRDAVAVDRLLRAPGDSAARGYDFVECSYGSRNYAHARPSANSAAGSRDVGSSRDYFSARRYDASRLRRGVALRTHGSFSEPKFA